MFKRFATLMIVIGFAIFASPAFADIPISGLPTASSVLCGDYFVTVHSGATSKVTGCQVWTLQGPAILVGAGSFGTGSQTYIAQDAGGVAGMVFNIPTSSSNGFQFQTNNATVLRVAASGQIISLVTATGAVMQWANPTATTIVAANNVAVNNSTGNLVSFADSSNGTEFAFSRGGNLAAANNIYAGGFIAASYNSSLPTNITTGDLGSSLGTTQGRARFGGSASTGAIDWNTSNSQFFSFTNINAGGYAPIYVSGVTSTGIVNSNGGGTGGSGQFRFLCDGGIANCLIDGGNSGQFMQFYANGSQVQYFDGAGGSHFDFPLSGTDQSGGSGTQGSFGPCYNPSGTTCGSTFHFVQYYLQASSTSTTITLNGASAFSGTQQYTCNVYNLSGAGSVGYAIASGSSFSFTSISGDYYNIGCQGT